MRSIRSLLAASMLLMPSLASAQNVLFYSDNAGEKATFASTALTNGWTASFWGSGDGTKTAAQLSSFNSLVIGWSGGTSNYTPILGSNAALTTARGNRTFLTGQDADFHERNGANAAAATLFMKNAVNWSASGTGLGVVVLSDYRGAWLTNSNSFLYSEMVGNVAYNRTAENVIIPGPSAGYPVNAGLTSASLSNWRNSYHMTFRTATPGYTTINLSGDYTDAYGAVTILTESEASGGTTATPEPASMVLLGTGLLGIFGVARRKRSA